ncbi:RNA-binding domain-containing protein [Linnemannia elongata AG-77]|uniref:RNA-binding domain-containing protein n=1 Tax=Linnemannia elongata AG-77 TaxID=1314771 RepID=A0A197JLI6_9FUNG|nr:RNA-binding domain-containing protein [Linnemannia elongata AG-77]
MFIGGLNWETTDESLKKYFSHYGELTDCMVMKDPMTNKSRGFGFLTFLDPRNVDAVLKEDHHLDGKMIDPKRAIPREEQEKTEKIFVGGIAANVTEEEFANYFSQFGHVLDATLMLDRASGRPRGFGFITFESDRGVDAALSRRDLMLHDKPVSSRKVILRWIFLRVLDASTLSFLYLTWLIVTHAWF